jgi:DnaJ-like protein
MPDELRSAYAVLGLQPGASLQEVKQQFKNLVRRWHPDRYANDPQGKAEANDRLRVINNAYSTILQATVEVPSAVRREAPPGPAAQYKTASGSNGSARQGAEDPTREHTPPPVGPPLTREQIDAMIEALRGHRPRKSIREQITEDPWNRGLSLVLVGLYILIDAVQTWTHPWSRAAAVRVQPSLSGPGPVMASVVGSVLWTLPLVWVIWYADAFSKKVAWLFLAVFAVLLPLFVAMMRI